MVFLIMMMMMRWISVLDLFFHTFSLSFPLEVPEDERRLGQDEKLKEIWVSNEPIVNHHTM